MDAREFIELLLGGELDNELNIYINEDYFDFEVRRNSVTGDFELIVDTSGYELVDSQNYEEMVNENEALKDEVRDLGSEIYSLGEELSKCE